MADQTTSSPLRVTTGVAGPHIRLPFAQLDEVKPELRIDHVRKRIHHLLLGGGVGKL